MADEIERLTVAIEADLSGLLTDIKKGVDEVNKKLDQDTKKATKKAEGHFEKLAKSIKKNWLAVLGVIGAFTGIIAVFNKLIQASVNLSKAQNNLAFSAAAANREFGNSVGTAESWQQTVDDLSDELRIFSDREVANATTRLVDMTKRLGLNEKQMQEVLRRTADLAAGKTNLEGAIERTTAALRGEAESAEFLGLSLNETEVRAYAEAQGLVFKELTDTEKAQQRYNLFLSQTNELQGRAAVFAKTLAGRQEQLTAQLENQSAVLGGQLLPLQEGYVNLLTKMTTETDTGVSIITQALAALAASFLAFGATATAVIGQQVEGFKAYIGIIGVAWDALRAGENPLQVIQQQFNVIREAGNATTDVILSFGDTWSAAFDQLVKEWTVTNEELGQGPGGGPPFGPLLEGAEGASDELLAIVLDSQAQLLDIQEQTRQQMAESAANFEQRRIELAERTAARLEDLAEQTAQLRADAIRDARQELVDLERETDQDLKHERDDFQTEELRNTEDHLREMRRLRSRFIFDLEGAVASRDARRIVDLQRQFALEKGQREEDFTTGQGRERQDQNLRLAQIRQNERDRAAEIERGLQQELNRITINEQRKRSEIQSSHQARMTADQAAFDEQQAQLEQSLTDRLIAIAKSLADQGEITKEGAAQVLGTLAEFFGKGGEIDKLMEDFATRRRQRLTIEVEFEGGSAPTSAPAPRGGGRGPSRGGQPLPVEAFQFAQGGSMIARKPTLAMFGEAGSELAQFSPLNSTRNISTNQTRRVEMDINMSGSAPPGIRSADRDQIAGVIVSALREAGINRS